MERSPRTETPSSYIPGDRRRALAAGVALPSHVRGAAMFADISGFTPLVEALANELGSQRASEALTSHLDRVFTAVIAELDRFGGEVIYFSGDAITCWLDGDDGTRAAACGFGMQAAVAREGYVTTPGGLSMRLELKVAIAVGPARRFVIGDPEIQLIDVLVGQLIDRIYESEQLAKRGEVLLDTTALEALDGRVEIREVRGRPDGEPIGVVERLWEQVAEMSPEAAEDQLPADVARRWLLPAVYERIVSGAAEFLGELRPAYPVFVRFGGIDHHGDEAAAEKLDKFVSGAQRVLTNYGGNLLTITIGDKGAYLFGAFGTPVAHEDDAVRACAAAIELHALEGATSVRNIQVGIGYGRLRSGSYGSASRRTFGCVGDAVNLSARLMSKAPVGETYVSEPVRDAVGDAFAWRALEPMKLKGKAEPVAAFALVGTATHAPEIAGYRLPMAGRAEELARLEAALDAAAAGSGRIIGISAQAGMGKSRLAAEAVQQARSLGFVVALGECQSYGTRSAYFVWQEIWRTLFGLSSDEAPADQVAHLEQELAGIDPGFAARAPLLGGLLGLSIPDNELTRSFDPKLRKTSLESLLGDCLHALGRRKPLLVVLEDCHWLDPLSRDLLDELAHATNASAVLLVLLYRPEAALPHVLGLAGLPHIEQLELAALGDAEMTAVVQDRLPQLGVEGEAVAGLLELVIDRVQGNPFYAEELLNYVRAQGIDPSDERALVSLDLPQSLHSLILSRIDELVEAPRRTLKVASVLGGAFRAQMLHGVYAELGSLDDIRSHLRTLGSVDLLMPHGEEDGSWLFKHAVTQEVVYESLPFALRASLHGDVGRYIEAQGPETVDRQLDLVAHHFWFSDDESKRRLYLRRAGDAARNSYANATAIDYYERLAPLLTEGERVDVLLDLGNVQELVGDWDRACTTETDALELARAIGDERAVAWSETALAEVARKRSRYDEGAELLARAASAFDGLAEQAGLGRVLQLEGQLEAMQGNYEKARERLEQSLEIRRRLGDRKMAASVLSNLGIVAQYQGDFELSRNLAQLALDIRVELADRWAIAVSQINLGMLASLQGRNDEAQARFEEAMRLNSEVGDSWAVTLCENNLGNTHRNLGDYEAARRYYVRCLEARRDRDDKWALAFLLEDVAQLAALTRDSAITLELIGAADAIREEIGAPRDPALEQEITEVLRAAVGALPVDVQARLRARGRRLEASAAIEVALDFAGASHSASFPVSPGAGPGAGPAAGPTHAARAITKSESRATNGQPDPAKPAEERGFPKRLKPRFHSSAESDRGPRGFS